jgi:hypothetical protein
MKHILLRCLCLILATQVFAAEPTFWDVEDEGLRILVNNRVLAKVNDKPITVMDVMRKLDMIFYQRYPQYAKSKEARYQFYEAVWRRVLEELIDKELLLVEAKELKLEVNNGEVRKEMERLFGPNVVANLDSIGMTYDEACQIVREDMINQRMMYVKVNAKVLKQITPKEVRHAYDAYVAENTPPPRWIYRVLTVRDPDPVQGAQTAQQLRGILATGTEFDALAENVENIPLANSKAKVTASEEYQHTEKELSDAYREVLLGLQPGGYSEPVVQSSRADKSKVFRIFYLKDRVQESVPTLHEMESKMRQELLAKAMDAETDTYLRSLRKKHAVTDKQLKERLPDDFQPFILK